MKNEFEIKKFMAEQLAANVSLSEIQSEVNRKFQTKLSFMDIRILAAELENVDWAKLDPRAAEPIDSAEEDMDTPPAPPSAGDGAEPGKTVVEVSKLLRPGAVAGGSVKFASGASAEWFVDQMGRLGLDGVKGEPTEADVVDFQKELQKIFRQG